MFQLDPDQPHVDPLRMARLTLPAKDVLSALRHQPRNGLLAQIFAALPPETIVHDVLYLHGQVTLVLRADAFPPLEPNKPIPYLEALAMEAPNGPGPTA
jgi:hypothetical protein